MAVSAGTGVVGQDILNETFEGLQSEIVPLVQQIGRREQVNDIAGDLFVESSKVGLAQAGDPIAIGADARVDEMDFTTTSYKCLRYDGYGILPDAVRDSLSRAYNYNALERAARMARQRACAKLNKKLNTVLTSTSLNTEKASGDWGDGGATSTPITDLQSGMRLSGMPDTFVLGGDVAEALVRHPDLKERDAHYSGSGAIPQSSLVANLRGIFPHLQNVIIGNALYNANNEGLAISLDYQFDGLACAFHARDLVYTYFSENAESDRIIERQAEKIYYEIVADIIRPHQEMGTVFTFASLTTA